MQTEDREQLEFGYCFDVRTPRGSGSDFKACSLTILGGHKSLLPSLGPAICDSVHTMVLHIKAEFVGLIIYTAFNEPR